MGLALKRLPRATYQDLLELPPGVNGELIDGALHATPRPAMGHANVVTQLGTDLNGEFGGGRGGRGGWRFFFEPEVHLGEDVVIPDYAAWTLERMPDFPDEPWVELAPDWLLEVLSPSTMFLDRGAKLEVYARERVRWVWLVDFRARTLEVLQWVDGRYSITAVHGGDAVVRAPPFDAVELDLLPWWGEPRRPRP